MNPYEQDLQDRIKLLQRAVRQLMSENVRLSEDLKVARSTVAAQDTTIQELQEILRKIARGEAKAWVGSLASAHSEVKV